ncbi:hypothetical protein M2158_004056 [Streptomyces sp. SAI-144]|uniref:hypothetical protein n=1 Tax=Streptomyces sp. SAI-144 TaxID=2940544 RepID=UPI002475A863|nr:hypothetical protein [Streptomyces sp. SAI-144]MDH6435579.1 hypothetical protein [Streptomyces sp. SAI-144]
MTAVEWLIWGALVCLVFWAYQAIDIARYLPRVIRRKPARPQIPHWARHGHLPPAPKHGRHARR